MSVLRPSFSFFRSRKSNTSEGTAEDGQPRRASSARWFPSGAESWFLRRHEDRLLLLSTVIIGAVVGLVVVAFIYVTENLGARMYPAGGPAWRRLVLPVIGALSTGWCLYRCFPDARGSGIPQTKAALFLRDGYISLGTVLGKFGLSSVSLASGIALGREGPSVQVGAGIASLLGRKLGLSPSRVKALVPVGASAALAAAFNTPIAAVLFTLEEVMGDLHAPVLGSIVLSSATSWIVLHLLLGDEPLFHVPSYQLVHPVEFLIYAALGVIGGLMSVSFVKTLLFLRKRFLAMPKATEWIRPVAGGLTVGVMGWFVPEVLGVGYGNVGLALNGQLALGVMILLVALKLLATATCYASGNAGGIFGPSLFMGAMTGGAVGAVAHLLLPDYTGSVGAYALVGMGAAFAGIIRVPLTSVIMIFEITRDYSIIVPLMIANLISYMISTRMQREPIYEALQHQNGIFLPSGARDRQEALTVSEGLRPAPASLRDDETVAAAAAATSGPGPWPVDGLSGFLGMVAAAQLNRAVAGGKGQDPVASLVPAPRPPGNSGVDFLYVHADDPLDSAMRLMGETGVEVLPVVNRANLREIVGVIALPEIIRAYGIGEKRKPAPEGKQEISAPLARLAFVVGGIVLLLVAAVSTSYYYRAQRRERAEELFKSGNELAQNGSYQEAIEHYRNALSISHSDPHRLALALALVKSGRLPEAEIYLREALRSLPNSGPANRGLAEVAAGQGRIDDAVASFHRAIYGSWTGDAAIERARTRIELAETLGKAGRAKQAQVDLLPLASELPRDPEIAKRTARLLLTFGSAQESADVFSELWRTDPRDSEAGLGLAEAEIAQFRYAEARDVLTDVLKADESNERAQQGLGLCEQTLAADPAIRGVPASERYGRSRALLETLSDSANACPALQPGAAAGGTAAPALAAARSSLARRGRPVSYSDAADANVSVAVQLWNAVPAACRSGSPPDVQEILRHLTH